MFISNFAKKSLLLIPIASAFVFVSCNNKDTQVKPEVKEALKDKNFVVPAEGAAAEATTSGDVALNPAHGQPGHDCAIPVGAPLNSKPASNQNMTPVQAPVQNQPSTAPTGSGMVNPPHGQPGHDCAVPVGAPL
ncbi:hypothetical protein NMK71_08515 [Weeksellaceae bacterium KMM 9713]|uniref:Uncharacterized protein n=1 Tax=Profundicola chukchiensis TaxID=2961959 RepID=A0A9X4RW17_9FLAO|nr:hypothetical protein [Profundicola chukchiensis]MDG4946455.1 hypothetical protein [Profundicola chukchiensis]